MTPAPDAGMRHGYCIRFLERAFELQLGQEAFFEREVASDGEEWLWIAVPAGDHSIGVGFANSRLNANPLGAFAAALIVGTLLVAGLAWRLASRIAQPVARLEQAAAQLGLGASPDLLPETGPSELADLAQHFHRMSMQADWVWRSCANGRRPTAGSSSSSGAKAAASRPGSSCRLWTIAGNS
jgi:two-component system osmolarity sensor histidine kinase EnvZ